MANLIITVISIALVAVAALMGAYYGGTAFMDGQVKSQANTIIEQAKQLEAAWLQYRIDHNNNPQIAALTDFVPNYMTALPTPPSTNITTSRGDYWTGWSIGFVGDDTTMTLPFYWYYADNVVITVIADDKVCNQIAKMARGNNAMPLDPGNANDGFTVGNAFPLTTKYDCFHYNAALPHENVFVYKVF